MYSSLLFIVFYWKSLCFAGMLLRLGAVGADLIGAFLMIIGGFEQFNGAFPLVFGGNGLFIGAF
jgi:hypothetical protein